MASNITMPRLSDSMEEGVVVAWLVDVGAEVRVGAELAEIETDKATMVYEAEAAGTLLSILVKAGEAAAVGAPIAVLGMPGEGLPGEGIESRNGSARVQVRPLEPVRSQADPVAAVVAAPPGRAAATPVARRLASAYGIELAPLVGTGPNGRIVKRDVLRAVDGASADAPTLSPAASPAHDGPATAPSAPASSAPGISDPEPSAPAPSTPAPGPDGSRGTTASEDLSRLQQAVARRMSQSRATVPDFEVRVDVDMGACTELRAQLKALSDQPPSFNDMIIKACALALADHRRANGSYANERFELHSRVNVGFAVASDDALVVPTVFDADRASLGAIARTTRTLAAKVRDGSITPPELSGGTFTVSNLGMFGVEEFSAVINPPQAAILAVGAIRRRPVVTDDDEIVVRPVMTLALSADHRILYGADAARLLAQIRDLLEQPLKLAVG